MVRGLGEEEARAIELDGWSDVRCAYEGGRGSSAECACVLACVLTEPARKVDDAPPVEEALGVPRRVHLWLVLSDWSWSGGWEVCWRVGD